MSRAEARLGAACLAAALSLALPTRAEDLADAARGVGRACRGDVEALCAGIQPGGGRIAQCLRGKMDQVSPGCRGAIGLLVQAGGQVMAACRGDVQSLCAGVQPGGGRIAQCLQRHASEVSAPCRAAAGR